jgi:hypothetical protein
MHLVQGSKAELVSKLDSIEGQRFVADCRKEYLAKGWCHIPNFLPADVVEEMRSEAVKNMESTKDHFLSTEVHTVYQEEKDPKFKPDHPRNIEMISSKRIVDFARLSSSSPLKALYYRPELVQFVQQVVGVSQLYHSICPFNAAMYNGYYDSHGLGWHFDRSEFGVNLVLQDPHEGGVFDYHRLTRSEEDLWSYDTVSRILEAHPESISGTANTRKTADAGSFVGVESVTDLTAGSLVFFSGRLSMHRVSPVHGKRARINAILTYEKKPDQLANAYSLRKFFGRTVEEQQAHMSGLA